MVRTLSKLLAPLARRLRLVVGRGVVNLVDDSQPVQRLQITVMADDTYDDIERFQNFGFTSVPLPGAEHVNLAVGGDPGHLVVVAVSDDRYRPRDLQPGESAQYGHKGCRIVCKADNTIEIIGDGLKIVLPEAEIKGHVTLEGHASIKTGWSGTFTDSTGRILTVRNGIIIGGTK